MELAAEILITLGGLFLIGLATDLLGRRTPLPRVTLLLLFGFLIGPSVLDLLPDLGERWFLLVADMALVMVGFLLGSKLTVATLRSYGRMVFWISLTDVLITSLLMAAGLMLAGVPPAVSLLLAGIAPATAPAATADVVRELRADGPFTRTLLGVVGIDDAWGLIAFSLLLATALALRGAGDIGQTLLTSSWEIGGAVLIGGGLGVPMAFLTGRLQPGEPTQAEALGMIFLCGGLALWLKVSFLLSAMVMGIVVANLARHHRRPFHAIEGIEWPFMILFFVLSGAALRPSALAEAGWTLTTYLALRIVGRLLGATLGASLGGAPGTLRRHMWLALMPQAGVALGMALFASQRFPAMGQMILPVVIAATVVFEVMGPILTRLALTRMGETRIGRDQRKHIPS